MSDSDSESDSSSSSSDFSTAKDVYNKVLEMNQEI